MDTDSIRTRLLGPVVEPLGDDEVLALVDEIDALRGEISVRNVLDVHRGRYCRDRIAYDFAITEDGLWDVRGDSPVKVDEESSATGMQP